MSGVPPTIHIVGRGVVGRRLGRLLERRSVITHDPRWSGTSGVTPGDVAVLAQSGEHRGLARTVIERGLHVVTVGDGYDDTLDLLELDRQAGASGVSLVVGAAMSPGLSSMIARLLAAPLASVDEIHVAIHGTAGPACAREHHRSLSGRTVGWRDGFPAEYVGGTGRELCWFPEPVGAVDCYRSQTATPLLLHRVFPEAERISARRSATRRDRLTAQLPMLRPPHQEGGIGALRVEVRGTNADGSRACVIAGVAELVGSATAATAAAFVAQLIDVGLPPGVTIPGDPALPTVRLLDRAQSFGVRLQQFTGVPQPR